MEKFSNKLIKESKSITHLCDEYDGKRESIEKELKSLDNEYSDRMVNIISDLLKRYSNYYGLDGHIEFESVFDDNINLPNLTLQYVEISLDGELNFEASELDDYGIARDLSISLSGFETEDLSYLLRRLLDSPKIVTAFGVNAVIKINQ